MLVLPDVPAFFLFKAGNIWLCFRLNQLHWRKRRGREEYSWRSAWQVVKAFEEFSVSSSYIQRTLITSSVKRCPVPQMGIYSLMTLKLLERILHFSLILMLLAERGRQTERLSVIEITYITTAWWPMFLCSVMLLHFRGNECINALVHFVSSLINCCYCQFTVCPSCC